MRKKCHAPKDWKLPAGAEKSAATAGKSGGHYDTLMAAVKDAIKGKTDPATITFCWMQGEADANHKGWGSIYGESLQGVLTQLQADLGRKDIDFVVGRINDFGNNDPDGRPDWNVIRAAQVKFAQGYDRGAWIDTDDLNGPDNALHFGKSGGKTLGERFAAKAIEMIECVRRTTGLGERSDHPVNWRPAICGPQRCASCHSGCRCSRLARIRHERRSGRSA